MTSALDRLEEKGVIRRVRTPAGAKRYGQPIGTIITRDMEVRARVGKGRSATRKKRRAKTQARAKIVANSTGNDLPAPVGQARRSVRGDEAVKRLVKSGFYATDPRDGGGAYGGDGQHTLSAKSDGRGGWSVELSATYDERRGFKPIKTFKSKDYNTAIENAALWVVGIHDRLSKEGDEYDEFGYFPKNRSYRDYDALPEMNRGIRGRDWWEEGDADWDSGEDWDRFELVETEAKDLGIQLIQPKGDFDPRAAMTLLAVIRAHEEMYPGFTKIVPSITLDKYPGPGDAYGWNGMARNRRQSDIGIKLEYAGYGRNLDGFASKYGYPRLPEKNAKVLPEGYHEIAHYSTSIEHIEQAMEYEGEDAKWQAGITYTMTHEIGHTPGWILFGGFNGGPEWQEKRAEYLEEFIELLDEYGMLKRRPESEDLSIYLGSKLGTRVLDVQAVTEHVSGYASSNMHEIFAETWVSYQTDENPGQFVRDMGALMEDIMTDYIETEGVQ